MMLRAAFVPPAEAVQDLRALLGRLSLLPGVHPVPVEQLEVPIAAMGNVSEADAQRLARRIEGGEVLAALPELRWSGIRLLEDGDLVVRLAGDVASLDAMARAVGASAERIHVYVDRRAFAPSMVIAAVAEQQPGTRIAAALARLTVWEGATSWTMSEIALIRIRWIGGAPMSEVVERLAIPAGAGAVRDHV